MKLPCNATLLDYFNKKAKETKYSNGALHYGGRLWEFMVPVLEARMKIEKIMSFLVEAGFNPDRLAFLKPMDKKHGTAEPQQPVLCPSLERSIS